MYFSIISLMLLAHKSEKKEKRKKKKRGSFVANQTLHWRLVMGIQTQTG